MIRELRSHKVHTVKSIFTKRTPGPDGSTEFYWIFKKKTIANSHTVFKKIKEEKGILNQFISQQQHYYDAKTSQKHDKKTINKLANRFKSSQQNINKSDPAMNKKDTTSRQSGAYPRNMSQV